MPEHTPLTLPDHLDNRLNLFAEKAIHPRPWSARNLGGNVPMEDVARLMTERRVRRAPVTVDSCLRGIAIIGDGV